MKPWFRGLSRFIPATILWTIFFLVQLSLDEVDPFAPPTFFWDARRILVVFVEAKERLSYEANREGRPLFDMLQ